MISRQDIKKKLCIRESNKVVTKLGQAEKICLPVTRSIISVMTFPPNRKTIRDVGFGVCVSAEYVIVSQSNDNCLYIALICKFGSYLRISQ